ncbi:glycosyl transferase family 2 [Stella humosa]|uniref:Glycosyl transferase family 2 n=1 Tax=Stella humosa TaxID=94 RepID=A0A3N1M7F5_9PROT|nr:glycosyltransferase family 2 protein [Stella humosa]ROP99610.1 glycosyl transferase family 2 [Stella humosa]BBK31165.1 hypothetical protein STHU_17990 [Stella humosa]
MRASDIRSSFSILPDGWLGGWAVDSARPQRRVEVFVWFDGRYHDRLLASRYRPDLVTVGIGDGCHGFEYALPSQFADGGRHEIRLTQVDGTDLPGSPFCPVVTTTPGRMSPTPPAAGTDRVIMLAIAKDEARYIEEWIAHHYGIGFRHFLVYDNDSRDGTGEMLAGNPRLKDIVEVVPWPIAAYADSGMAPQYAAYTDALSRLDRRAWVAVLDLDEFLVLKHDRHVQALLERYRDASALSINWRMFGSSGLARGNDQPVAERFRYCGPAYFAKTISRVALIDQIGVHAGQMRWRVPCDELRRPIELGSFLQTPSYRSVQINHYFTKSRQEWEAKRARGRSDRLAGTPDHVRLARDFVGHDLSEAHETDIDRHAATTRAAMERLFPDRLERRRPGAAS